MFLDCATPHFGINVEITILLEDARVILGANVQKIII